eukprot:s620_g22.t1
MSSPLESLQVRVSALEEAVLRLSSQVEELARTLEVLRIGRGRSESEWQQVSKPASEASLASEASRQSSNGAFNALAQEIPAITAEAERLCSLLTGGQLSWKERAHRAWESGYWARFVLAGRIHKPRPSAPCDLANTCYIVLRAPGFQCPLRVQKASDYRSILKDFNNNTISHGFASQAEARVYCLAAGVKYPTEAASVTDGEALIGPHTVISVPGVRIGAEGPMPAEEEVEVQLVDVSDMVLPGLVLWADSGVQEDQLMWFSMTDPSVTPDLRSLLQLAVEWLQASGAMRATFYSAAEEEAPPPKKATQKAKAKKATPAKQVADHISTMAALLPTMAAQLAAMQEEQRALQAEVRGFSTTPPPRPGQQPVTMTPGQFTDLMGAPPKTKGLSLVPPPPRAARPCMDSNLPLRDQAEEGIEGEEFLEGSPLTQAVLQQSRALTALVLQMQSGDPLFEGHSSSASTSSRGAQGREKLQRELAQRSGNFFLTVMQNMHRRMKPATPVPGSFGNAKDMGVTAYAVAYIVDCALKGDLQGLREHLALLVVGLEQYSQDTKWDLGFILMLLEDPPSTMFSCRSNQAIQTGRNKAFAPLCPQRWATISLAYLKELDFIQTKRMEQQKKGAQPVSSPPNNPSPKRRGKYPKAKQTAVTEAAEE